MKNGADRFCYVGSIYSLLTYIAYSTDEQLKNTFYLFDWMIPSDFAKKFRRSYHFRRHMFIPKKISWLDLLFQKFLFCPHICKNSKLFANDHLWSASAVIGKHSYTLLEDSAGICSNYWNGLLRSTFEKYRKTCYYKIRKFLFGPVDGYPHGNNEYCTDLLLTTDEFPDYIRGKKIHRLNWLGLWDTFSEWKKKFIMDVYDFSNEDLNFIKSKSMVLFTQPLYPDLVSEKEHERIYKSIIEKYPVDKLLVKTHPRDKFSYKKINDKIIVFRKKVPSQIFDMLGVKFNTAITVFSSAAKNFQYPIKIDWYGTECSDLLYEKCGHMIPPSNACLKSL